MEETLNFSILKAAFTYIFGVFSCEYIKYGLSSVHIFNLMTGIGRLTRRN